tara:strand:+ start:82637 stop:83713 length:1077 start_codon:yes stop_codon:yes gene_type:complete
MKFLILVMILFTQSLWALEIDEKLTMRIVGTSETRKTILINRGTEDGLIKGDHAKFYLSLGVVARGVAIKVSPGRSVWSIYRLVNADYIKKDEVMKLKITAPVKITKDESRTLVDDDTPSTLGTSDPRDLGIPLADGANDLGSETRKIENDLNLTEAEIYSTNLRNKNRELFGNFHYSSRSSEATSASGGTSFTATETNLIIDAGFEYYFPDESKWYSRIGVVGSFRLTRVSVQALEGTDASENSSYFGFGLNWYPLTRPSKTYKFIPFGSFGFYLGSTQSAFNGGDSISNFADDVAGSFTQINLGGGVKYFMHNGFGALVKFDYETRTDSFAEDSSNQQRDKTGVGPRIYTGLLYRF